MSHRRTRSYGLVSTRQHRLVSKSVFYHPGYFIAVGLSRSVLIMDAICSDFRLNTGSSGMRARTKWATAFSGIGFSSSAQRDPYMYSAPRSAIRRPVSLLNASRSPAFHARIYSAAMGEANISGRNHQPLSRAWFRIPIRLSSILADIGETKSLAWARHEVPAETGFLMTGLKRAGQPDLAFLQPAVQRRPQPPAAPFGQLHGAGAGSGTRPCRTAVRRSPITQGQPSPWGLVSSSSSEVGLALADGREARWPSRSSTGSSGLGRVEG